MHADLLKRPLILMFSGEPKADDQRVKIYPEGGVTFETFVPNVGWILEDEDFDATLDNLATMLHSKLKEAQLIH